MTWSLQKLTLKRPWNCRGIVTKLLQENCNYCKSNNKYKIRRTSGCMVPCSVEENKVAMTAQCSDNKLIYFRLFTRRVFFYNLFCCASELSQLIFSLKGIQSSFYYM